jgi:uncharacterized membrane protein
MITTRMKTWSKKLAALWPGTASAVRLLAVGAALASPLVPPVHREGSRRSVVYVVDRSESVSDGDRLAADGFVRQARVRSGEVDVGLVAFDSRPELVVRPGGELTADDQRRALLEPPRGRGSDIAGAIRLAGAALPPDGERRVVVLSDGHGTGGDTLAEVERLRRDGITVDAVPLGGDTRSVPAVASVRAVEPRVSEGEPVLVEAGVHGRPGERVSVQWLRDGIPQHMEEVTLDEAGRATATLHDPSPVAGRHIYEAQVLAQPGSAPQGAVSTGRVLAVVAGRPRVLLLSSTGERQPLLMDALRESGADVREQNLDQGEPGPSDLDDVDLVVLDDVAMSRRGEVTLLAGLTETGQQTLIDYVSERGGGLLVLGGVFGFGPEYSGQSLTRLLPVEIEDLGEIEDPSVAMTIMLDRSGSMGAWVGGHTKLALAIEAALAAAVTLRSHDRVAIATVDEVTTWHFPLGHIGNVLIGRERIRAMNAGGGGIYVYTALADAYGMLRTAGEPIRHVLLFSDTSDSEEQWSGCPFNPCDPSLPYAVDLARQARAAGITTSVVGIGSAGDTDTQFLRDLAAAGGGRFYLTGSGTDLRRIFVSETRAAARSSLREEHIEIEAGDMHQVLEGLDVGRMPAIEGFVQTGRRATADTALLTSDGHPVLASWRYGLGTVVAWTTDAGVRWTTDWAQWDGAGQLMRQMVRFAMRRREGNGTEVQVALRERGVELDIQAPEGGESRPPARVELITLSPDGQSTDVSVALERVAPGRWRAAGRTSGAAFAVARVLDEEGRVIAEEIGSLETASELALAGAGPDERVLRELSSAGGGVYDPDPPRTLRVGGPRGDETVPSWPWLLLLSAALACVDLWVRRLGRGQRDAQARLAPTIAPHAVPAAPSAPADQDISRAA